MRNYLRDRGVMPGRSDLGVTLERSGPEAAINTLTVSPATALIRSDDAPYDTTLDLAPTIHRRGARTEVTLDYVLRNRDRDAAESMTVEAKVVHGRGLRSTTATRRQLGDVRSAARGTFRFEARDPGTYNIVVRAAGTKDNDGAMKEVRLVVPAGTGPRTLLPVSLVVVGLLAGTALMVEPRLLGRGRGSPG